MKISILQDKLNTALKQVIKSVENKPTLPILGNILLTIDDGRVKLSATNLEHSTVAWVGAKIDMDGPGITLPAKTLADVVAKFPPERIDISVDYPTQTATLKCGASRTEIKGIDIAEFPLLPEFTQTDWVISAKVLKQVIAHAQCAAAREQNRPILCGIHFEGDGHRLTVISADGFRLYVSAIELDEAVQPFEVTLPLQSMLILSKLITDVEDGIAVQMPGQRDLMLFGLKHMTFATQILDGKFPAVDAIVPKTYEHKAVLYTADLFAAVERGQVFGKDSAFSMQVIFTPPNEPGEPGSANFIGMSAERGMLEGMMDCTFEGAALTTNFNSKYMLDVPFEDERIVIETLGPTSPIVMRPEASDNEIYVIMPMGVNKR